MGVALRRCLDAADNLDRQGWCECWDASQCGGRLVMTPMWPVHMRADPSGCGIAGQLAAKTSSGGMEDATAASTEQL